MNRLLLLWCALLGALILGSASAQETVRFPARGQVPAGYPADYLKTIRQAEDEGRLVIYSNTDLHIVRELVQYFQTLYPRIEVEYQDLGGTELHHRYVAESTVGPNTADVLWSSAMDLQMSLVGKGYAQPYASPEAAALPPWANWDNQAFATTYEPVVIVYNKRLLPPDQVPQSHADLTRLLVAQREALRGKVVTYNPVRSAVGYLFATQDASISPTAWELVEALGGVGVRSYLTSEALLSQVASGNAQIAYNALGTYAARTAEKNAELGYVLPKDYTLVTSRVVFISRKAPHPNAARLWLDYLLSARGQTLIANQAQLFAVRTDIQGATTASGLIQQVGDRLKPIALVPDLSRYVEEPERSQFLRRWRAAVDKP